MNNKKKKQTTMEKNKKQTTMEKNNQQKLMEEVYQSMQRRYNVLIAVNIIGAIIGVAFVVGSIIALVKLI